MSNSNKIAMVTKDGTRFTFEVEYCPDEGAPVVEFEVVDRDGFVACGDFPPNEITAENLRTELSGLGFDCAEDELTLALVGMLKVML